MHQLNEILFKCFQQLEFDFDNFLVSKKDRIVFQKYCLLFKKYFGIGTGCFSLYINGPYNSDLASIGYEIANDQNYYRNACQGFELSERAIQIINVLKNKLTFNVDLLEVYCTYIYLLNYMKCEKEEAISKLRVIKSHIINSQPNILDQILQIDLEIENDLNVAMAA